MPLPQRSNSIDLSALLLRQSSIFEPTEKEACLAASVEESFEAAFDCGYTSEGEGLVDPMAEIADTVVPQTTTGLDDASGVWPQPQQQQQPQLLLPEPAVPVTLPLCFYPTDYTLSSPIASPLAVVPTSGKRRASRALRHASPAPSSWSEAESSGADSAFTEEHEPEALSDDEYVPSPRSRAAAGRSTTSSSSSRRQTAPSAVRQFSPRMAPFNWPEDVLSLDTKELNQYIKMHALSASQVRDLKTTRRRLKNRQYARVSRDRKARLHTTDTATTDGSEHDFSAATTPVFFQ